MLSVAQVFVNLAWEMHLQATLKAAAPLHPTLPYIGLGQRVAQVNQELLLSHA